jgi:hypothetical protein
MKHRHCRMIMVVAAVVLVTLVPSTAQSQTADSTTSQDVTTISRRVVSTTPNVLLRNSPRDFEGDECVSH